MSIQPSLQEIFCQRFNGILPPTTNYFVSGGIFPRLFHNLPIRDVDVFALNHDAHKELLSEWFMRENFEYLEAESKVCVYRFRHKETNIHFDVIKNGLEDHEMNPLAFIQRFDFTICRIMAKFTGHYPYPWSVTSEAATSDLTDIATKKLKFSGNLLFGSEKNNTLSRLLKYAKLGFEISDYDYELVTEKIYSFLKRAVERGVIQQAEIGLTRYDEQAAAERVVNSNTIHEVFDEAF